MKENKLLKLFLLQEGDSEIKIYQDVNIYVAELMKNKQLNIDKIG